MSEAVHRGGPDRLTDEQRDAFERLAEKFGGEDVGDICDAVLQSSAEESEEANS